MLSFLAAVLATVVAAFHSATYLLWHYERCRSGGCGHRLHGADLGPWLVEGLAIAAVVVTWPLGLVRASRAQPPGSGRPVLLVHGWGLNRASTALLAARLRRDGHAVHSLHLPWRAVDLTTAARAIAERIRSLAETSGVATVDVVAYGVGGVLVRVAAQTQDTARHLGHVVTVGSPHRGSALALLGLPAPLGELRPGAAVFDDLVRGEKFPAQLTAIASPFDAIVFPFDLAYCPGAFNVAVEGVGHFSMLYSERVCTLIAENLAPQPRTGVA